eukprot:4835459-Amphidinium_carterae.3
MGNMAGGDVLCIGSFQRWQLVVCPCEGRLIDLTRVWYCLDASQYHGAFAITEGVQYSISAYVCKDVHKLATLSWA